MKSLEFFKPTLVTTLAIVLAWLPSIRPAQAGYIVTLQQVGPNVVATGSGAINLTGLTFFNRHQRIQSRDIPGAGVQAGGSIVTGPTSSSVDLYYRATWTDEFRERWRQRLPAVAAATWSGYSRYMLIFKRPLSHCSKGLCLRYFSIEQRDLQRQDYCNFRRNTGYLRMDVGNRTEPKLHATNPSGESDADTNANGMVVT